MTTKDEALKSILSRQQEIASSNASADSLRSSEIDRTPAKNVAPASPFAKEPSLQNVCSASKGAKILFATDEWFAAADNLLKDGPPIFDPSLYCEQGKVMDGWESRRRRESGHDWCLISLSHRTEIFGVELDTAHFTGNQVPRVSLELADVNPIDASLWVAKLPGVLDRLLHGGRQGVGLTPKEVETAEIACDAENIKWQELLPRTPLRPGYEPTRMHHLPIEKSITGNYLRVNYFPDGGVARLRVWGALWDTEAPENARKPQPLYLPITTGETCTVVPHSQTKDDKPPSQKPYKYMELSASKNGGEGVACSNKHYGEPSLLIQDTLGKDMGDGWETARHPDRPAVLVKDAKTGLVDSPLSDWAILKLGKAAPSGVTRILLDTKHFRGNYPESVLVEGCFAENGASVEKDGKWFTLVKRTRMSPDAEHVFDRDQIENASESITHVRISIFPDGGVSRVRVYGKPADNEDEKGLLEPPNKKLCTG